MFTTNGQLITGLRRLAIMGVAVSIACSILWPNLAFTQVLRPHAHVYLLSGFTNAFSWEVYDLATKIQKQGIYVSVHSHFEWPSLAEQAIKKSWEGWEGPVIIIGYSFRADAAASMADGLAQAGLPANLVVTLSPVASTIEAQRARVVNVSITTGVGVAVARARSFGDQLLDLHVKSDTDLRAFTDRWPTLNELILGYILRAVAQGPARAPLNDSGTATSPPEHRLNGKHVSRSSGKPRRELHLAGRRGGFHRESRAANKTPSKAESPPERGSLSPNEREVLFQQFLRWRKNGSP